MRATTVRIIKCDEPAAWYAKHIGRTFEVYVDRITSHPDYVLREDYDIGHFGWRYIDLGDAVEIDGGV